MTLSYEALKKYEGMIVLIVLKNSFKYQGKLKQVTEEQVVILDKFNQLVTILPSEISLIIEKKNGEVKNGKEN